MTPINWPSSLQERLAEINFALQFGDPTISTDMDSGISKKRARYTRAVDSLNGAIYLTIPEYITFTNFFKVSLGNGVNTFYYNHPITQVQTVYRFKGVPQISSIGGGNFTVSFSWEEVP